MNNSPIEWTDHTWNPVSGCSKVSQGCKNCYAERVFGRVYSKDRVFVRHPETGDRRQRVRAFTDVRTHMDRLEQPLRMRKGRRIFVNSMSDLFHEDVPNEFIADVFGVIAAARQHTFQVLTKRPERMRALLDDPGFPEAVENCMALYSGERLTWPLRNLWLGVSVEDQATADERIPLLLQTPAAVRFISAEPLIEKLSLLNWVTEEHGRRAIGAHPGLHLVIAGGESGPGARPSHPDWFRLLRDQCASAGWAFFFKQWGEWEPIGAAHDHDDVWRTDPARVARANEDRSEFVDPIGGINDSGEVPPRRTVVCERVGKKNAGRLLDGREHSELPA